MQNADTMKKVMLIFFTIITLYRDENVYPVTIFSEEYRINNINFKNCFVE